MKPTTQDAPLLRRAELQELSSAGPAPIDAATREGARAIVESIRDGGEPALRAAAARFDGTSEETPLFLGRDALARALERVEPSTRALLERVAARIERFARAQRAALNPLDVAIEGGRAGHDVAPVDSAGCYAPGGRYPLPSSVLMTAVTARSAGVERVIVASPNASDLMLAAAAVAGADGFLAVGGAQAIAALAYGVPELLAPVDVVVGPGNRWVTAAKELVYGQVGIDLPAGPSELVVVADASANPEWIAADLLAQAEHDVDARPILVAFDEATIASVDDSLRAQLSTLASRDVAREALKGGFAVLAGSDAEARSAVDALAPEHLQLCVDDPEAFRGGLRHYGAAFIGERSAEVFGDYGAGPNHVLPTGRAARFSGGLSVMTFLRTRTWLAMNEVDEVAGVADDAQRLAALEGLVGHERAAAARSD